MTVRRSLSVLAVSLVCVLACAGIGGAAAVDGIARFEVPACEGGKGGELAPASPEGVLVPLCERRGDGKAIRSLGTVLPDGRLLRRSLPGAGPFAVGPAGEIWAGTGSGGATLEVERVGVHGTETRFPLGSAREGDRLEFRGLVPDGEGAVWVAIGELGPESVFEPANTIDGELLHVAADGTVTRFPVPESVEPQGLVLGPDGNLWFTGESGRSSSEHTFYAGKGYVGRMTPAGEFALFPTAVEESAPGGIAVGPDGRLWFTETSNVVREIGTVATDGTFGPSLKIRDAYLRGPIAIGPDGNAWLSVLKGLMRVTPHGQQTVYPALTTLGVAVGAEGDVWTRRFQSVLRVVPGAPGIDTLRIEADRRSKAVRVQLACGGSKRGCEGTLTLSLPLERGTRPGARLAEAHYSVAAESRQQLTIHLPAEAFALARQALPKRAGASYVAPVVVRATVAGGQTLDRRFRVPGLVTK
jgi:virginiamycin B lyase